MFVTGYDYFKKKNEYKVPKLENLAWSRSDSLLK